MAGWNRSRTVAFILAGGVGKRLSLLTRFRAKPAVPFAGRYRIIDFTLTNCVRSDISEIYMLTQYISRSLVRHLGIGKPWDLDRIKGGLHILHPHLGRVGADWYQGTADAFYQNIPVLESLEHELILILSGDHIYRADYAELIDFHLKAGLPASVAVTEVPRSLCREFGIATVGGGGEIRKFEEKPLRTKSNLASMGIYVFNRKFLISKLTSLKSRIDDLDFGKHVLPHLVAEGSISAFRFNDYWLDIGTLKSYFTSSLALLGTRPRLKLSDHKQPVLTVPDDYPPGVVSRSAHIRRSLVSNGCVIGGEVRSSILSPGVVVEKGAVVENSIIFHDCVIKKGARVRNAVLDKMVVVGRGTSIGYGKATVPNVLQPAYLDFGVTLVGRETKIPGGIKIGSNCLVCGSRKSGSIPRRDIADGSNYLARDVRF
jgi:glucose-1-phosphate adenylyltransferase